jgi:hypothetical protein
MRALTNSLAVSAIILVALSGTLATARPAADDHSSVVIVFKDGHRQSLAVAQIARLDFKAPSSIVYKDGHQEKISTADIARIEFEPSVAGALPPSRAHFIGKWEVGEGNNGGRFYITLDADGSARKTLGASHGTWTLVDSEARIAWDDGWHDVIRKVGTRHEKVAYEPGKTYDEPPSNVTAARNTQPKPI